MPPLSCNSTPDFNSLTPAARNTRSLPDLPQHRAVGFAIQRPFSAGDAACSPGVTPLISDLSRLNMRAPSTRFGRDVTLAAAAILPSPTKKESDQAKLNVRFPSEELLSIYQEYLGDFESIAASRKGLSTFLSILLAYEKDEVERVLAYFKQKCYSTEYTLTVSVKTSADIVNLIGEKFECIETLVINTMPFSSHELQQVLAVSSARELELHNGYVLAAEDFTKLKYPKAVDKITLSQCAIDTCGLDRLIKQCIFLQKLVIANCPNIIFKELDSRICPTLTSCQIYVAAIGGNELCVLFRKFPGLEALSLNDCVQTMYGVQPHVTAPKTMIELRLENCTIDDELFRALVSSIFQLRELVLIDCSTLTAKAFYSLPQSVFEKVESMILVDIAIDGQGLGELFQSAKNLQFLEINECTEIPTEAFSQFEYPEQLDIVDFKDTLIDLSGVKRLLTMARGVTCFNLEECTLLPESFNQEFSELIDLWTMIDEHTPKTDNSEPFWDLEDMPPVTSQASAVNTISFP